MYGYENDDFVEGEVNWSLIPSARYVCLNRRFLHLKTAGKSLPRLKNIALILQHCGTCVFIRSSQTVRRHEKSVDFDAIEENLQQSTSHLNR